MDFSRDLFDKCIDRTQTGSIKWDPDYMIERFDTADLLPFNHAEMDFECPQPIIDVVQQRCKHGIYGYTLVKSEYYDSVTRWYQQRHRIKFLREEILYSTGVIFSLRNVVQFFTNPGDEILLFPPIYRPLAEAITDQARKLIMVPLYLEEGNYHMDFDRIEKVLQTHSIKLIILCNPHNPIGRVWTRAELLRLGDLCLTYNVMIVADEIHCDLLSKGHRFNSIVTIYPESGLKTIALSSMTKTFNTSGLKISNIFIKNLEIREPFFKFFDKKFIYAPNVFGILGLQAAYNQCAPWVDLLTQYLDDNFLFVQDYLRKHEMNIDLIQREGTPVIWLDFRRIPIPQDQVFQFLLEKARIISYDGRDFTANGEGFQRLSIGYPRKILQEGLDRIENALKSL
ncbi:MAG: putative C-S lyase [Promethearchaeota archaeon]|nr:MAG: putative C-S lyase [Candidatus Lokiarchaeota archaeon]